MVEGYVKKAFYFTKEEWKKIEEHAKAMGITPGAFVKMAVRKELERDALIARLKYLLERDKEAAKEIYRWLSAKLSTTQQESGSRSGKKMVRVVAWLTPEEAERLKKEGLKVRPLEGGVDQP